MRALISELKQQHYVYYMVVPLRGPQGPARLTEGTDYSDPSIFKWANYPPLDNCSYIKEMLQSFEADVTNVRLMRLEAGAVVKEHSDPMLDAAHRNVIRLTVPVFSNDDVKFLLNDSPVPMRPGEVWYLRLSDRHSVLNDSPEERINLSIDLVYNNWLEAKLTSNIQDG